MTDTNPTGPTGPTELEARVLTEVFRGTDLIEGRGGVATVDDLIEIIDFNQTPATVLELRQAIRSCLRRAWLRVEPASEKAALTAVSKQHNLLDYSPTGRDRLLITDAGVRQLPFGVDRLVERDALTEAGAHLDEAERWLFVNMLPHTPTPSNMGARYDALAEKIARAIVAASRAAVAQGDYWTRPAFMNAVTEHFDAILAGDKE
jgi:hypothetical protein